MKAYLIRLAKMLFVIALALGAVSALIYATWLWLIEVQIGKLAAYAIGATLAIPAAVAFGYWLGKVEARGLMTGIDTGIDKLSAAVGLRDNSTAQTMLKVNHWQASQRAERPNITVQLPGNVPMITHRQAERDDILDL